MQTKLLFNSDINVDMHSVEVAGTVNNDRVYVQGNFLIKALLEEKITQWTVGSGTLSQFQVAHLSDQKLAQDKCHQNEMSQEKRNMVLTRQVCLRTYRILCLFSVPDL